MDTAELQLLRDRLRVLEAAVGSNRAIGGGSSAGISASINQLQLPTEPDLDVAYVPIGDHLDTRFAPFLPQSGAGIHGQPGLLLERPLIGDAAYDTAKKGTAAQRFRSQIYRHDFSACAYLTLAADAAAGGFQLLQDAETRTVKSSDPFAVKSSDGPMYGKFPYICYKNYLELPCGVGPADCG